MGRVSDLQIELEAEKGEPTAGDWAYQPDRSPELKATAKPDQFMIGVQRVDEDGTRWLDHIAGEITKESDACLMTASLLLYEEAKYNDTLFNELLTLDLPLGLVRVINKRKECNMKAITAAEIQP